MYTHCYTNNGNKDRSLSTSGDEREGAFLFAESFCASAVLLHDTLPATECTTDDLYPVLYHLNF